MADHSEHIHDTLADDKIGGAIKASPGRPPAEFYSSMNIPAKFSMAGNYYHERCLQLEGQLTDANRKIQQITDELFQARKDLSQDKTELLLAHQNEIARLKEEFRDKLDGHKEANTSKVHELEKEIVRDIASKPTLKFSRTRAATPSPSFINPRSKCSVPI